MRIGRMDPNACIRAFLAAEHYQDRHVAMVDYGNWIRRGGFRGKIRLDGFEREVMSLEAGLNRMTLADDGERVYVADDRQRIGGAS